jgi:conjugal transfer pilus assembly protein TraE
MFADISHERQQSLLRQRNLFALTSAGLGIALVVAGSLAATRDREVVLVPTLPKQLTVSSAGVEADYLELVTRDAALVLLNRSPEGLDYWMDEILKLADPASYGRLKAELVRIVEEQRGSDVTQAFVIRSMTVDPQGADLRCDRHAQDLCRRPGDCERRAPLPLQLDLPGPAPRAGRLRQLAPQDPSKEAQ